MKATVFIGGGRITSALIAGLRLSHYRSQIVVHDRHQEKLRKLKLQYRIKPEPDLKRALDLAEWLIIAVRPSSITGLLQQIGPIQKPLLAVSLAAGIPLTNLRKGMGPPVRWARAMPSPVSRSGRGLIGVAYSPGLPQADRRRISEFFGRVGTVIRVPEPQFDIFTAAYSSSHGYHAVNALAGAAEKLGLNHRIALAAAAHALADGIISWREECIPLAELVREAATPGGIAAAVMNTLDENGYARMLEQALRAGVTRAQANAKL